MNPKHDVKVHLSGRVDIEPDPSQIFNALKIMLSSGIKHVTIDLTKVEFLYPAAVVLLTQTVVYIHRTRPRKVKFSLIRPEDPKVEDYLSSCGFYYYFGLRRRAGTPRIHPRGEVIRLKRRRCLTPLFSQELVELIKKHQDVSFMVERDLIEAIIELEDNVKRHSESEVGWFVLAQGYPNSNRVRMVIGDLGIGIRSHLSRHPDFEYLADKPSSNAIIQSLQRGVTGALHGEHSGEGLYTIWKFIDACGGSMVILSEDGCVLLKGEDVKIINLDFVFPGTFVVLKVNYASDKIIMRGEEILTHPLLVK